MTSKCFWIGTQPNGKAASRREAGDEQAFENVHWSLSQLTADEQVQAPRDRQGIPGAGMTDYLLQVKIKNGPMMRAMKSAGYPNGAQLAKATGVSPGIVGDYLNLKRAPVMTRRDPGMWKADVLKIAEVLNVGPSDLFPPQHINDPLAKNHAEFEMSFDDVENLISTHTQIDDRLQIEALMKNLTPREVDIVNRVYGIGVPKQELHEVAEDYGVGRTRIEQIAKRSLRHMKNPGHKRLTHHHARVMS